MGEKSLESNLSAYLERRDGEKALRVIRPVLSKSSALAERDGRELVNFSSNDYLNLAHHPSLIERSGQWAREFGAGAGASRLVCGTSEAHVTVESKVARLKGTAAALLFGSGYLANAAVLPALFDREMLECEALVFTDRLIHASLHHGVAASGRRQIRYRHNDMDHLESLLKSHADKPGQRFIVTESVFSMDGDRADMEDLVALAEKYGAFLYVDEAHATGVLGPRGMGLAAGKADLVMGTFSKALGGFGAYVACSEAMKQYLINRCSGFIYATAPPPSVLGAMDAALDLVPGMDAERKRLHANAQRLRQALEDLGINTCGSDSQIVPALLGSEEATLKAAERLERQGILAIAIRPPTVPPGTSRIRFTLSAGHGEEHMAKLLDALPELVR